MVRGEREQICLDKVWSWFFKSEPDLITKKMFNQVDIQELSANYSAYVCSDIHRYLYGLTQVDRRRLSVLLGTAKENPEPSVFPDFISANGFIEHFEITASVVNRKGSTHRREYADFEQRVQQSKTLIQKQLDCVEGEDKVISKTDSYRYHDRSHSNLIHSFQTAWKSHCRSLEEYDKGNELCVFMVEFQEFGLEMCENVFDVFEGISVGDLREQQKFHNYRLSRDKVLLNWIHENSNGVDYVVFVGVENMEIIKISSIPKLLTLLPWDFVIVSGPTVEVCSIKATSVSISDALKKGE